MSTFQIKDGQTPRSDTSALCDSCMHGHVIRGQAVSQRAVFCGQSYEHTIKITWHVTECNEYRDRRMPSLTQYEKIAWHISADKKGHVAGFKALTPEDRKKARREQGKDDDDSLMAPWET